MNAQSIWAGEEYAFYPYRPNQTFVMGGRRLRAIKVVKRREFGNSKMSSFVIGTELDKVTGEVIREEIEVRTRDVIDFWEDYENERKAVDRKRQEAQREAEEARARFEAERQERLRREEQERNERERVMAEKRECLVNGMVARGIPKEAITSVGQHSIQLDRTVMEVWLSVDVPAN